MSLLFCSSLYTLETSPGSPSRHRNDLCPRRPSIPPPSTDAILNDRPRGLGLVYCRDDLESKPLPPPRLLPERPVFRELSTEFTLLVSTSRALSLKLRLPPLFFSVGRSTSFLRSLEMPEAQATLCPTSVILNSPPLIMDFKLKVIRHHRISSGRHPRPHRHTLTRHRVPPQFFRPARFHRRPGSKRPGHIKPFRWLLCPPVFVDDVRRCEDETTGRAYATPVDHREREHHCWEDAKAVLAP